MIEIRLTKPQRPIAEWLIYRLSQEGVPEAELPVLEKAHIYFPPSIDLVRMAYHLLTYEFRVLWKEQPETLPGKPVTADSMASALIIYSRIQAKMNFTSEELEELRGRSFSKVKGHPSRAAIAKVREVLEEAVDRIGPELLEQLRQSYIEEADRAFERFLQMAKDPARRGSPSYNDRAYEGIKEYIRYDQEAARKAGIAAYWHWTWETAREHPEVFYVDHPHAERQAKIAYDPGHRASPGLQAGVSGASIFVS